MKFKGQYCNCTLRSSQDLSRRYEQTYKELAPFARDEEGNFLNDSPYPVLVEAEKVDIQERIDSFKEDVDLYSILKKVSLTGDLSYLDKKAGFYGDFANMPNNYNDLNDYYKRLAKDFREMPEDIREAILSGKPLDEIFKEDVQKNVQDNQQENIKESEIKENENK